MINLFKKDLQEVSVGYDRDEYVGRRARPDEPRGEFMVEKNRKPISQAHDHTQDDDEESVEPYSWLAETLLKLLANEREFQRSKGQVNSGLIASPAQGEA